MHMAYFLLSDMFEHRSRLIVELLLSFNNEYLPLSQNPLRS